MLKDFRPEDIKSFSKNQLNVLCDQIRNVIYDTVNVCGGHLSSNLGAVESTVAMFYVFDFPSDKVVFDVGHQCYPYKLLSGRYDRFLTLRKKDGISGFPKRNESIYDSYDTGHAGTSVSAALGIAKARDLCEKEYSVIAYIGDGSFNNGLVYEALTSMQVLKTKILIVLNDNGMSISPTVGGMADILKDLRTEKSAESVRLLESFGLKYVGVKNGNDVEEMVDAFTQAKELLENQSVLLHISTKKGKGYEFCEEHPSNTHGVAPVGTVREREYSDVLGETLCKMAKKNDKITVVSAAMTEPLGLTKFFEDYPDRAFDVGICEESASVLCASMASAGLKPYYTIYSTFLQRAFDEIIHDVCQQDLPVTFCIDRAGISGADGETHQGVFDLSYLSLIPNMTIAVPKDTEEFEKMLLFSENYAHPLAIRYPRAGKTLLKSENDDVTDLSWGYVQRAKKDKVTVLACGERCLIIALKVAERLKEKGVEFSIVNARFVKPLDKKLLDCISSPYILTMEDNVLQGGFGSAVNSYFANAKKQVILKNFAYRDEFIPQGAIAQLQSEYGVSCDEIAAYIESIF